MGAKNLGQKFSICTHKYNSKLACKWFQAGNTVAGTRRKAPGITNACLLLWIMMCIAVLLCHCWCVCGLSLILFAVGKGWQDRVEAAFTFCSIHVGLAAMAVCSVGQRRLAERAGFLQRSSEVVKSGVGGGTDHLKPRGITATLGKMLSEYDRVDCQRKS